jgi:hypothetical protein
MSFAAKYSGYCNSGSCNYEDNRIHQGDEVAYFDDELMHVECAKKATRDDYPCCRKCFQYHRGECL